MPAATSVSRNARIEQVADVETVTRCETALHMQFRLSNCCGSTFRSGNRAAMSRSEVDVATHFEFSYWVDVAGIFLRELVEAMALVMILGLLPVGAHYVFSLEKSADTRAWVVPELYLFVMVACGQAAGDAFRDPERGLSRTLAGIAGSLGVLLGAGAYGILYVGPTSAEAIWVEQWLRSRVIGVMLCVSASYAIYRGIRLFGDARAEAAKNRRSRVH
jgi:hypothetical protein